MRALCAALDAVDAAEKALRNALLKIECDEDANALSTAKAYQVLSQNEMAMLRCAADALEAIVPREAWPIPDYCDLLFDL